MDNSAGKVPRFDLIRQQTIDAAGQSVRRIQPPCTGRQILDGGTQQIGRRCVGVKRVQRRDDLFEQDLDAAGLSGAGLSTSSGIPDYRDRDGNWKQEKPVDHARGLLAGAIAYYALLSVVPLMILAVIALSRLVDQAELLRTLDRYLEWLVPSQSRAVLADVSGFLDNGIATGAVLFLGAALLAVTFVSIGLRALAEERIHLLGRDWSLSRLSGVLFHLLGVSAPYCAAGTSRLPPSSLIAT